jgi:hypothetical protein
LICFISLTTATAEPLTNQAVNVEIQAVQGTARARTSVPLDHTFLSLVSLDSHKIVTALL